MKKINLKKVLVLMFILLFFSIPVCAEYIAGKITNVNITRIEDSLYIEGETIGFTSKMNILLKVLDDAGNLQYFNTIPVDANGEFYDNFVPMDMKNDSYLNFIFSGDLAYSTKFYYSNEYSSSNEALEATLIRYLQDYIYYKDSTSKYAMNFVISYEHGANKGNVVLTGTNFDKDDNLFTNKDEFYWISYLSTIKNLAESISHKEISVLVYDRGNNLIFTYPGLIISSGENNGGSSNLTDSVLANEILTAIGQTVQFNSNGNPLTFNVSLDNKSTSNDVKLSLKGNFSKNDDVWKNSSLIDLENFARSLFEKIQKKHPSNIEFTFIDKDEKILNTYSYYKVQNGPGEEIGTTPPSTEGGVITPTPTPSVTPDMPSLNDDPVYVGTTDEIQYYKPWTPLDDLGVYTLNLMVYSSNNTVIEAPLVSEGYEGPIYKYNYALGDYEGVLNAINSLRNDSKKVLVVRGNTLGSNINFTVSSQVVDLLKANNVTLVFDTSYLKVEADFGSCNYSGDYVITTNETIARLTDKASNAYNISVTLGGMDVSNVFGNKPRMALHYTHESAAAVSDLRFVSNYYNNSTPLNTTIDESLKAFISVYNGSGIYCARENRIVLNDSNFEDNTYKRYAEVVVSKGLMNSNSGTFNPKFTMTRGEFVEAVAKKMGVSSYTNYFSDLLGGNPYYMTFNGAYEYGLLPSSWKNGAQIDKKITIEEMIYIIVRCYEVNSSNPSSFGSAIYYRDAEDISAWAKNKVAVAAMLGLIPTDGYLYPLENGTREDAAELLFKLMDKENLF